MNYESELYQVMIDMLKKQYGIQDEYVLFRYFSLRFFVYNNGSIKTDVREKIRGMVKFLWKELNLPEGDSFWYKGEVIKRDFTKENSLINIMESWHFENQIREVVDERGVKYSLDDYLKTQQEKMKKFADSKIRIHRSSPLYFWYWKHFALTWLNIAYHAKPTYPSPLNGVVYPETHTFLRRTLEEEVEAYVHAHELVRVDAKSVSEQDLENFLYPRLHLLERGLVGVSRQLAIPDGRIDILGKDRNDCFVIIELKVKEDKELVWQCMYYPLQIKKMFNVSKVRMITLAPSYSNSLSVALNQLEVEMITYSIITRMGKVEDIFIRKRNSAA